MNKLLSSQVNEIKNKSSIYLEKGKWLENGDIRDFSGDRIYYCKLKIDFSSLEPLAQNIKTLRNMVIQSEENLTTNDYKNLKMLTNLEHLELSLNTMIPTHILNSFENLSYLKLKCNLLIQFPEFLFKNLTKLKELNLVIWKEVKLNSCHFIGLENLQTFKLNENWEYSQRMDIGDCLNPLVNLKHLELEKVILNQLSLLYLDNIEKLRLVNCQMKRPLRRMTSQQPFENLKSLKYLEINHIAYKEAPFTVPSTVETLKTNIDYFESIAMMDLEVPFNCELKSLEIEIDNERVDLKKFCLFTKDCSDKFKSLEILHVNGEPVLNRRRPCFTTTQLKTLNNLKVLTLKNIILTGVDVEFNYLTEASFSMAMPTNMANFYNLEKLCLEYIRDRNALNETFLEELVNLEELELNMAFKSIDSKVKYLFKNLTKLKKLTMKENAIAVLKYSYFDYLVNLEELNLANNYGLEIIEPGSFEKLFKLKSLNLSGNNLQTVYIFSKDAFSFTSNNKLEKVILKT